MGVAGQLHAQNNTSSRISNTETEPYYFVPALHGAWMLELGARSRIVREVPDSTKIPELDGVFRLGYRTYFDDWARSMASGYITGSLSLDDAVHHGQMNTLGLGVQTQLRGMDDQFIGLLISASLEAGVVSWSAPTGEANTTSRSPDMFPGQSPLDDDLRGYRLAAGIELGFGLMVMFDPYIFAENPIWFGVEHIDLNGASWTVLQLGFHVRFDFIHR